MNRHFLKLTAIAISSCFIALKFASAGEGLGIFKGHHGSQCTHAHETLPCDVPCKVCKPVPDKKKVTKVVYECKEEWYCLSKCPKHNCCDPCAAPCPACDKPRCRRILVKKIITEEKPTTKCVVETVTR